MKKSPKLLTMNKKNEQTQSEMAKNYREQRKTVFRRRRLTIMFVVACCVFTFMGISLFQNGQHLSVLQETHEETKVEYDAVQKNKKELTREVTLLNDEDYVEKIARAKYFYSKEGEKVYSIPELNGSN